MRLRNAGIGLDGSDGQGRRPVRVVRVETAFAIGAEQVGDANGGLAQHQLQVAVLALRADFPNIAKGHEVKGGTFAVDVVDHRMGIEFAEDELFVGAMLAAPRSLGAARMGWHRIRDMYWHWSNSMIDYVTTLTSFMRVDEHSS
jgi:hypothetical protein